jgi:hypothetical protein
MALAGAGREATIRRKYARWYSQTGSIEKALRTRSSAKAFTRSGFEASAPLKKTPFMIEWRPIGITQRPARRL